MVEPGRSIAATAGVTLYRVGTIKEIPGVRTYVVGRRWHERQPPPRPLRQRLRGVPPRAVTAPRPLVVTVVGKHCESGDLLVRDATLPADLAVGDVLCTPVTGAYGHSMASNYNKVPRPAVVFVAGTARPAWSSAGRRSTTCCVWRYVTPEGPVTQEDM